MFLYLLTELSLPEPEDILKITPAGLGGYGLALFVLCVVSYGLYRKISEMEDYIVKRDDAVLDFNNQILAVMIRVDTRLSDAREDEKNSLFTIQDIQNSVDRLRHTTQELIQTNKELLRKP